MKYLKNKMNRLEISMAFKHSQCFCWMHFRQFYLILVITNDGWHVFRAQTKYQHIHLEKFIDVLTDSLWSMIILLNLALEKQILILPYCSLIDAIYVIQNMNRKPTALHVREGHKLHTVTPPN